MGVIKVETECIIKRDEIGAEHPLLQVTCIRCKEYVNVSGLNETSIKQARVMLRERCPHGSCFQVGSKERKRAKRDG